MKIHNLKLKVGKMRSRQTLANTNCTYKQKNNLGFFFFFFSFPKKKVN